jgi:predicted  nucleic acid-binding Zn-ribbon protein
MPKKAKATRRKATDATLRNVRASKNRDGQLGAQVAALRTRLNDLERQFADLTKALRSAVAQI